MAPRRHALLLALAGLHAGLALLLARSGVELPAAEQVVYADLMLVAPPRPRTEAAEPPPAPPAKARTTPVATRRQPAAVVSPAPSPVPAPATPAAEQAAPALDLVAMRAAAGEYERKRRRDPLERVQDEQRIRARDDSDGARAIRKAGREDCVKKYSGGATLDPLRLIPLLYDTVTDTGCKW
ncbi:hypothetical protein E7V67_003385 [[Empedobacter] haloabium]|uniref:Energy transducer TonB n=1 Tax=[Empedobacter] haloabium TaxID=592317 RepID=A0ABZ1UPZ3_9BURK